VQGSRKPKTTGRSGLSRSPIAATVLIAVLVAGCGGSSGTTTAKPRPNDTAASAGGSPQGKTQIRRSALDFAKCVRANGVPNFPDPNPGGGFQVGAGLNPAAPAVRAALAKCQKFMPGGGPLSPGPPPSAKTLAQLRKIAVCMRERGVPQFPDPRSSVPSEFRPFPEYREITNYMGAILLFPATIDPRSPAYEQATAACGAGFLAGNNAH
jgi:hypothetical protein